jgi:hypothetical protein
VERKKCAKGGYDNSCHEFRSSRTGHHPKQSHRMLYAASSVGLSGFSEMNLASTSPQSAHVRGALR